MKQNNRNKQLVKNTAIVAIGQICTKFISFFLLPLYTALLSTQEYGTVDLLNTYVSLIIPVVFFQMDQAIFRFLIDVRNKEKEKKITIATSFITISVQALLYLTLYLVFGKYIKNSYRYFLATNVISAMFSSYLLQISRGFGDNTTYSIGSLISGAGTVIFNVIFIAIFRIGAKGMLLASLISNVICAIFVFIRKRIYVYIKLSYFNKNKLKELWKYSMPLIPNQLSWWIINASDRTIISIFLGITINGIYSAANKFSSIIITFFNIFNMTWAESASIHFKDEDNSAFFTEITNTIINLFTHVCLIIIAIMPFIFKFMITGKDYASAYYQIPVLLLSTIFNICVCLFGSVYVALKKTKEIAKTSIYSAIINIVINLLLINFIGLYAASVSTLLSYFAMTIYRYIDIQKYIKIKINFKNVLTNLALAIVTVLSYYMRNNCICLICLIVLIIYAFTSNKKILISIKNIIFKKLHLSK